MRNITISIAGAVIEIEDDSEQPVIPSYSFSSHVDAFKTAKDSQQDLTGIVVDDATGLMWSAEDVVAKACTQEKAEKACKELRLGGFDDWRLPTRKELLTLVDDTRHSPAIDTDKFPSCKSAWYWTSTPYAADSGYAWIVNFGDGHSGSDNRGYHSALARAVRSVAPGQ